MFIIWLQKMQNKSLCNPISMSFSLAFCHDKFRVYNLEVGVLICPVGTKSE
jgi:hypothetical protein